MKYKVVWKEEAIEDLTKIDRTMAQKIFDKVENYLTKNPTEHGKPLVGNLKGLWSYRFKVFHTSIFIPCLYPVMPLGSFFI